MNVGMHSQGVRLGTLSDLIGRPNDFRDALLTAREMLPVVQKRGIDLSRHRLAVLPFRLPRVTAVVMSWLVHHVKVLRVNLEAQANPAAEEPRAICRDALADARRFGVPMPHLEAAEQYFTARCEALSTLSQTLQTPQLQRETDEDRWPPIPAACVPTHRSSTPG